MLGVSAHAHKNWGSDYEGHAIFVRSISLVLMVLSIFMAVYAAWSFNNRGEMLQYAPYYCARNIILPSVACSRAVKAGAYSLLGSPGLLVVCQICDEQSLLVCCL